MGFSHLRAYNYRNLLDLKLDLDAKNICLVGNNGQGKSNILEALYVLSYGSSFRTHLDSLLINQGQTEAALSAEFNQDGFPVKLDIRFVKSKKSILMDDNPVQDRKDLVSIVPCIIFSHDDFEFAAGAPDRRRWFFNQTMSLAEPNYIDYLRNYSHILRVRNQSLKNQQYELLDVLDSQLAQAGNIIQKKRKQIVEQFNMNFAQVFRKISGLPFELSINYRTQWAVEDGITEALYEIKKRRDMDIRLSTSTSGPHRDKFIFLANGKDFSAIASTGQLRLLSLLLRASQAKYIATVFNKKPVLLLDDVLLELDAEKRKKFMEILPEYQQAFFTFLPDEEFSQYIKGDTIIYRVENGRCTRG